MATTASSRPERPRERSAKLLLLGAAALCLGAASTALWLSGLSYPHHSARLVSGPVVLALLLCIALTSANLLTRWLRWHFLIRRFSRHVLTRDSFAVYLSTLPAIITPFFLGELVRVMILRKRFQQPSKYLVRIWFAERALDAGVLLIFYLLAREVWVGALSALAISAIVAAFFGMILKSAEPGRILFASGGAAFLTVVAWAFPVLALHAVLRLLEHPAAIDVAAHSFSAGTLFGGLTGLPLGVFVTGSTMIAELAQLGVPPDIAVVSTLVHRAGTAWFAVAVGILALFAFRRRLSALLRVSSESHFDELAPEYEGEIPEHVRARLLDKKIGYIVSALAARGIRPGARGLDLGCGQGWYLAEFVRRGYSMDGADYSAGQIEQAGRYLSDADLRAGALLRADAQALPFEDSTYDFVYSINAFHHMLAPGAQQRALREAVRVLRPGGVFVLHEMNTENPVFRLYMGYVFPLLKRIDEGNEEWLLPSALPDVHGAAWSRDVQYFTFLPDFVPAFVQRALAGFERWLERSPLRRFSAHYQACLEKRVEPS